MSNAIYEKFIDLKKKANFWLELTRLLLPKRGIYIFEYFLGPFLMSVLVSVGRSALKNPLPLTTRYNYAMHRDLSD